MPDGLVSTFRDRVVEIFVREVRRATLDCESSAFLDWLTNLQIEVLEEIDAEVAFDERSRGATPSPD